MLKAIPLAGYKSLVVLVLNTLLAELSRVRLFVERRSRRNAVTTKRNLLSHPTQGDGSPMPMVYKFCETCEARYGTFSSQQKYCSNACRQRAYRESQATAVHDETTLTLKFGKFTVKIDQLDPASDKESLRRAVIEALGPELIAQALASPPQHVGDEA